MSGQIMRQLHDRETEAGPLEHVSGPEVETRRHWQLGRDEDNIAWLLMDKRESGANVLSGEVLEELDGILRELERDTPRGLVLRSAKDSGFCMGADIHEFTELESEEQVVDKLSQAHEVADRLEALDCPTVAVIHGPCLGGGLELALCCDYRLAIRGAKLGFPEIQLGLHPGLGGTARMTQLIDPLEAMTLMLTGKPARDGKAKKLGMVDAVIEERHVANAVRAAVRGEIDEQDTGLRERVLTSKPARQLEARQMRARSAKQAPPRHYPAPEALISLWEEHGGDRDAMLRHEIRSFARLLTTDTSRNLVRVFFLREKMKGLTRTDAPTPQRVHVIGAGEMGGDIAGWCAFQGLDVTLFDMDPEQVGGAVKKAAALCEKKHLSAAERRAVLDRLTPDLHNHGIRHADLVIEAVPEKIEIKQKVYDEVEPQLKEGAILATNTSSIPLEQLREHLKEPARLVGLHFFNPVAKMPLVEIVRQQDVEQRTLEIARAFTGAIDKLPAPVASAPGFLVNRALTPYLMEALAMLDEGSKAETIDRAAEEFGMPMGPVELADQVGLDICQSVGEMLRERLDTPMPEAPSWLRDKVENGKLGKKTGEGLYQWKKGKPEKDDRAPPPEEGMGDRLVLPMLNACMALLEEGVIDDEDLADGAMIFGTGFAPFRGGPMHYARKRGFEDIADSLERLARQHGERFQPHEGWRKQAGKA